MVGKGEEVRQRHTDRVNDEHRRELDSIERGEGVQTVKKVVYEEENILEKSQECEGNRQESGQVEHEDVDFKEEAIDCDEEGDCTFQYKKRFPEGQGPLKVPKMDFFIKLIFEV